MSSLCTVVCPVSCQHELVRRAGKSITHTCSSAGIIWQRAVLSPLVCYVIFPMTQPQHTGTDGETRRQVVDGTRSPAVAERPRDASCLSVVSFNSTKRRAQAYVISYFRFRFTAAYKQILFSSLLFVVVVHAGCDKQNSLIRGGVCRKLFGGRPQLFTLQ